MRLSRLPGLSPFDVLQVGAHEDQATGAALAGGGGNAELGAPVPIR